MILVGARFFIVVPTVPLVQSDFGIQPSVAQLIISAPYFFTLISFVIAGFIIRKFRTYRAIFFVLVVSVPGSLLCLFAPTFTILLIGRVWQALTLGVLLVAIRLLISEDSDSDKTIQKLLELFSVGILASAAAAPAMGAALTVSYGWRSVHALILLLTVITCMLAWSYRSGSQKYQAQEYTHQVGRERSKSIFSDRTYLAYMIQSSFHFGLAVTFISFLPHHVITQSGESYGSLGIGASLLVIGVGVGAWLLYLDGRITCTDGQRDRYSCETVYDTRTSGALALGSGATLLGLGLASVVINQYWPKLRPLSVAPTSQGGYVTWSQSF